MSEESALPLEANRQLILVGGYSGEGKSASLMNIRNQERWYYLNTEAGKQLPFKNSFQPFTITDPYQVYEGFDYATGRDDVDGIILDSKTFLMDMLETMYIRNSTNTQKAWGDFAHYLKELMLVKVPRFGKPVIITAHVLDHYDEKTMSMKTYVPIKGALKNNGIESFYSTVVAAKKKTLKELEGYSSDLLNISEDDEILGYKHVFQTRITKETTGERIRSPMGLFSREQTFMDNDVQILLDHLQTFYN